MFQLWDFCQFIYFLFTYLFIYLHFFIVNKLYNTHIAIKQLNKISIYRSIELSKANLSQLNKIKILRNLNVENIFDNRSC